MNSPFPSEVLGEDCDEPLQTTQDCTMDNNGSRRRFILVLRVVLSRAVLQTEALRQLEVELDSSTLEGTTKGITDGDIDFGAVESTVTWVELPLAGVLLLEGFLELLREFPQLKVCDGQRHKQDLQPRLGPKSRWNQGASLV